MNAFISKLKKAHEGYAAARREVIGLASEIQTLSKRAIFAYQRGEAKKGAEFITKAARISGTVRKRAERNPRLMNEGAYRASLEEYAEAVFFRQILEEGRVTLIPGLDEEAQIGGLSDMIGEVVRRMTLLVTEGDLDGARKLKKAVEPVMDGLNRMDYRGSLRSKYDQAVRHYRKAEDILYDISLKH
jgi:predicted translin family RNA/ssDNA-binding protein